MFALKRITGLLAFATATVHLSAATGIRILEAVYGEVQSKKICKPDLSLCKGRSVCEFTVTDGLCTIEAPVKNLEVTWDCGPGTEKHARAAAKGTKISLSCTP